MTYNNSCPTHDTEIHLCVKYEASSRNGVVVKGLYEST